MFEEPLLSSPPGSPLTVRPRPGTGPRLLALLALVGLVAATALVGLRAASVLAGPGSQPDGIEPPPGVPADAEVALVDRIVDGDTLRVVAAPGTQDPGGSMRVRLLNIDAPELARDGRPEECLAREATQLLASWLAPGDRVWLAADLEDRDHYDRLLRAAWTDDGWFVNEHLARAGLAEALLVAPNDRFHAEVVAAERAARDDALGIWGAACAG